jgi:hypothetical protein
MLIEDRRSRPHEQATARGSWNFLGSEPFGDAAVVRTRTSSAGAEAVTSISTLRGGSLRRPGAVLRSRNSLPFAVHIGAIARAIHLAGVRFGTACG